MKHTKHPSKPVLAESSAETKASEPRRPKRTLDEREADAKAELELVRERRMQVVGSQRDAAVAACATLAATARSLGLDAVLAGAEQAHATLTALEL